MPAGSRGDATRRAILTDELASLAAAVGKQEARLVASMVAASYAVWDGRNADGDGLAEMATRTPSPWVTGTLTQWRARGSGRYRVARNDEIELRGRPRRRRRRVKWISDLTPAAPHPP